MSERLVSGAVSVDLGVKQVEEGEIFSMKR